MDWILGGLSSVGVCLFLYGILIAITTINSSVTGKNSRFPVSVCLILLGFFILLLLPRLSIKLTGLNILMGILLPWIHIAIGLGLKFRLGNRLLKVGQIRQRKNWQWGCLMLVSFGILFSIQSLHTIQQPWFTYSIDNASTLYMPLTLWSLASYNFLRAIDRLELSQNAISCALLSLSWNRITSYQWLEEEENTLILRFQPRLPLFLPYWKLQTPASKKDDINSILVDRLPGRADPSLDNRGTELA
jgi:hypothetical protein